MRAGCAAAALAAVACCGAASAAAKDLSFDGEARAIDDGALLYRERHAIRGLGGTGESRVVLYLCPDSDQPFARKRLDYSDSRETPEFSYEDARLQYSEGLVRTAAGLEVYQKAAAGMPRKSRPVPSGVAVVSDAGFDEFVKHHWAELEAGKTVRFPFLIPSRLDYLTFKVRKYQETVIEGGTVSVIRLNLSGLLGFFLPYIEVSYRKADRVLLRYKGLTNVRDANGDNLTAQIDFAQANRREGPVDLAAALARPLVRRCS